MSDADKRMSRSELAKELRERIAWFRRSSAGAWPEHMAVLEQAAAALEEEDRDARRYQVVRRAYEYGHVGEIWYGVFEDGSYTGRRPTYIRTMRINNNGPRQGWYSTLDAAIDAWLEGEGKT